jgi:hypothetical protein
LAGTLAVAAAAAAAAPPAAVAASNVKELRREPCPAPYLVAEDDSVFSQNQINQAHRWRFTIATKTVRLKPKIAWKRDPISSQTFRAGIVGLNWLRVSLYDYRVNNNERSLRQARDIVLDFVRNQPLGGRETSSEAWDAKTVGDRSAIIAYVTRAASCEGILSAKRARTLLGSLAKHANWIRGHRVPNNHGLFDAVGLAAISRQVHFLHGGGQWGDVAKHRFEKILRRRMKVDESFWLEQTSIYQWEVTNLLDRLLEILRIGPDDLENILGRMKRNSAWLVVPDRKIVQFGDSQQRRAPDEYRELSETQSGLFVLPRSGYAFVRQGSSYLALASSFHNSTHKHADELSFDLYDRGHRIVSDTGFFHKDPGRWFRFTHGSSAHSTVTLNGDSFPRASRFSYGSGIAAWGSGASSRGGTWYAIKARNPLLGRNHVSHQRWLVYKPGVALVVVDRLRSGRKRRYKSYFHLGPDLSVSEQPDALGLSASGLNGALYNNGGGRRTGRNVLRGSIRPLQGWTSPAFRVKDPRATAIFKTKGTDADRVTTVSLSSPNLEARAVGGVDNDSLSLQLSLSGGVAFERLDLSVNGRSISVGSGI